MSTSQATQTVGGGKGGEAYDAAALRHFRDGSTLRDKGAWANADQLYGLAAECAIKSALVQVGLTPGQATFPRVHIDKLWDRVHVHSIQKAYPCLSGLLRATRGPFAGWSTDQRYSRDEAVDEETCEGHRQWSARVLGAVGLQGSRSGG